MIVFIVLFLFQSGALAAGAPKIGVVDVQRLQKESTAFRKLAADLKRKIQDMQLKLDKERGALREFEEEFKKQSMMLSLDAQGDKKRTLGKKRRKLKYLADDFTQDMKAIESEVMQRFGMEIRKIVQKIGQEESFTLIFEKRSIGVMYNGGAIDVTDKVIKAYDKIKQ